MTTNVEELLPPFDPSVLAELFVYAIKYGVPDQQGLLSIADLIAKLSTANYQEKTDNYTLALTDVGGFIAMNKATAVNLTVPPNASVAIPVKSRIDFGQYGAGQVALVAGSGVTIRNARGLFTNSQYSGGSLLKIGINEWWAFGDLTT